MPGIKQCELDSVLPTVQSSIHCTIFLSCSLPPKFFFRFLLLEFNFTSKKTLPDPKSVSLYFYMLCNYVLHLGYDAILS